MPAYSPKRYPPARPFVWTQRLDPANRVTFTAAEERWMAERLAVFGLAQTAVPPEVREGRIPRVRGLPGGFGEEDLGGVPAGGDGPSRWNNGSPESPGGWRFRK